MRFVPYLKGALVGVIAGAALGAAAVARSNVEQGDVSSVIIPFTAAGGAFAGAWLPLLSRLRRNKTFSSLMAFWTSLFALGALWFAVYDLFTSFSIVELVIWVALIVGAGAGTALFEKQVRG